MSIKWQKTNQVEFTKLPEEAKALLMGQLEINETWAKISAAKVNQWQCTWLISEQYVL